MRSWLAWAWMAASLSFSSAAALAAFASANHSRVLSLRTCRLPDSGFRSFFTTSRAAPAAAVVLDSPSSIEGQRLGRQRRLGKG